MNKTRKKIVYVADDDRAIVDALRSMLESAGYEVDTAYDESVLVKISERIPHLLLLDIWMSGTDGRDICKKLKSCIATKNMPIIMVSANPDTGEISRQCGANDYIRKPFEIGELLHKIETQMA